jgi:hypothetical protein
MNATGYSLGATYAPNWMDWPMLYAGNPVPAEPDVVFFLHMIPMDGQAGVAMCPGQTVRVADSGCEVLSARGLDLVERRGPERPRDFFLPPPDRRAARRFPSGDAPFSRTIHRVPHSGVPNSPRPYPQHFVPAWNRRA